MRLERKKNTLKNAAWGIVNRVIALLGPFAVRTLIIYMLGTEYLGLSSLFSSILQVLNMAELGFGSAVAYCMYDPVAKDDKDAICSLLNLFRKVYKIVGIAILGFGLILMPFLRHLISGDVPLDINIYGLYILYLLNSGISYLLCAYRSVLFSAFQREDIISRIYSVLLILEYIAQIGILLAFKNYYAYYGIVPVITVLNNACIYILSKKYYPEYEPNGIVTQDMKKIMREKVAGIVISKFCGLTRNSFDSIVISMFIGLNTVAVYSNYYYIINNLSALLVILVTSMKAGIGNSMVMDTPEKNYKDFIIFSFLYMWISSWCSISLLCLYQPFMKIWVHEKNMFPFSLVILFAIYFWGLCAGDIVDAYSGAAGLWWENRKRTIAEAITNLGLNFILGYYLGVGGIILATIITIFAFNFIWKLFILHKYYFLKYNPWDYIKKYFGYICVLIVCGSITLWVCNRISINDYWAIIVRGVICLIVPNILMYFAYRRQDEFEGAVAFIYSIIKYKMKK